MANSQAVIDSATNWAYAAGWAATKRMPERAAQQVFRTAADTLWWQNAGGVDTEQKFVKGSTRFRCQRVEHTQQGWDAQLHAVLV